MKFKAFTNTLFYFFIWNSLSHLKSNENNDNINNENNIYLENIYVFTFFSNYYMNKKHIQDINATMQCLHICKKFLKYMKKVT